MLKARIVAGPLATGLGFATLASPASAAKPTPPPGCTVSKGVTTCTTVTSADSTGPIVQSYVNLATGRLFGQSERVTATVTTTVTTTKGKTTTSQSTATSSSVVNPVSCSYVLRGSGATMGIPFAESASRSASSRHSSEP